MSSKGLAVRSPRHIFQSHSLFYSKFKLAFRLCTLASGEPALCMAANVVCAVKNAIRDALSELGPQQPYFPLSTCLHVADGCAIA